MHFLHDSGFDLLQIALSVIQLHKDISFELKDQFLGLLKGDFRD